MANITYDKNVVLGRGAFGTVYKGWRDGRTIALKVPHGGRYSPSYPHYKKNNELNLMLQCAQHRNIVRCYGHITNPYGIILEYCHGSLEDFCEARGWDLPDGLLVSILKQLNEGLLHLHDQDIVHRYCRSLQLPK